MERGLIWPEAMSQNSKVTADAAVLDDACVFVRRRNSRFRFSKVFASPNASRLHSPPAFGWNGSDAFGARRFDIIVPLAALGYVTLLEGAIAAPLAVPVVVSKNTNELKIGSPGRFGIDVYTLGWPMGARILGHEDAAPALDTVGGCRRWLDPA